MGANQPVFTHAPTSTDAPYHLVLIGAELVDAIADQAERDRESFNAGWHAAARVFFDHGYQVGHAAAHQEMARDWHQAAGAVRPHRHGSILGGTPPPSHAEHLAMDASAAAGEPCGSSCGDCSRCIRAEAVARHGGDYGGGPVPWEPQPSQAPRVERGAA